MSVPQKYLIKEFDDFARSARTAQHLMQHVADRIHMHIPRYNWAGFYLVEKNNPGMLVLGPHTGSFTPNERISIDQGLCGMAASSGRIVVADNVAEEPRYLQACDMVKSQISAPIAISGKVLSVFHLESYFLATFKPAIERQFVENCVQIVARCMERTMAPELVNA
jgi:L-methionine (R)-S-oxide reductase